jgi:hypothetical protein
MTDCDLHPGLRLFVKGFELARRSECCYCGRSDSIRDAALRVLHFWDMNSLDTPHSDAAECDRAFEALRSALGAPKVL